MKSYLFNIAITTLISICTSCSAQNIINKHYSELKFSDIKSDYSLVDLNNYGCERIDSSVLKHILKNGTWITEKDVHDYYSTTGCTIKGNVAINNKKNKFVYDYGGIIYFENGKILGCGENCCREDYPNCSYDKSNLHGF